MSTKNPTEVKYIPQRILNIRYQNGMKMVLIKFQNFSIEKASWEPWDKFSGIQKLIAQYQKAKLHDQQRNLAIKKSQNIDCGQNPYEQTSRHGHFMYGDIPESIQSLKVFQDNQNKRIVVYEIKWKSRIQRDSQTQIENVIILQNSFLDSKIINEYRPDFLGKFYEKCIRLNQKQQQI